MSYDMLDPIAQGWVGKIEEGIRSKQPFDEVAEQCMAFFSHKSGFMWDAKFRNKFIGEAISPRFKMTIAKAFELVALFGPTLYWKNPNRACRVRKPIELDPTLFAPPPDPMGLQLLQMQMQQAPAQVQQEMMQQMMQQQQQQAQMAQAGQGGMPPGVEGIASQMPQGLEAMLGGSMAGMPPGMEAMGGIPGMQMPDQLQMSQQLNEQIQARQQQIAQQMFQYQQAAEQREQATGKMRAFLMEAYLNYTPVEQPGGGLAQHSETAITEALVKGRGCLWPDQYKMPGSKRTLTGCFFDSVDNLIIDPDAECLEDAYWIAQKCVHPVWQVERDYKLEKGSLEGMGDTESAYHQGESRGNDMANIKRERGLSFDLITYYKVWSKAGVGSRLTNVHTSLSDHFDKVVGDYAYIVVAPNVNYPLNAPTERFSKADDEEVKKMFEWPVPYWMDDRWPVCVLDFYRKPRSAWPIAPLAPGMGELAFLNVMISQLANRIWMSSRDFIAVLKSALPDLEAIIKRGEDMAILPVKEIHQDIRKIITFLQQPQTNFDVWKIIEAVMQLFDRRTGLSELLYGLNPGGAQIRTATDSQTKHELVSVRPDYMAAKVEAWQSQCARMEKFAARWFVEGHDVVPLLGKYGAMQWQKLISDEDPEKVVREMDATVEAGSSRKPNKERDAQNINSVLPVLAPEFSKHADMTSDTGPFNELIRQWGETIDQDTSRLEMGQRTPPPPPPEMMQQQQQQIDMQMQAEQAKIEAVKIKAQADMQKGQAAMAKSQLDLQKGQMDMQGSQLQMQANMQKSQMDMQREQMASAAKQAEIAQKAQQMQLEQYIRENEFRLNSDQDQQMHVLDMVQDRERHSQELQQAQAKGRLDIILAQAKAKQQADAAKQKQKIAAAQAKKKQKPSGASK